MTESDPSADRRRALARLLGLPNARRAAAAIVSTTVQDGVAVETLELTLPSGAVARAFLTRPDPAPVAAPGILYIHAHGGVFDIGAAELIDGRPALLGPLGPVFAREGWVSLALDLRCFGSRADEKESATAKRLAWYGRTLLGDMVDDLVAATGWMQGRDDVDPARIAAFGLSMGATLAYFTAAVEPRISAVAQLCCFADFAALVETGAHDRHGHYMTVPGLLAEMSSGDVAGLVAPRPQFVAVGMADALTPEPAFRRAWDDAHAAYEAAGAPGALRRHIEPDTGHVETPAMREAALVFLQDVFRKTG